MIEGVFLFLVLSMVSGILFLQSRRVVVGMRALAESEKSPLVGRGWFRPPTVLTRLRGRRLWVEIEKMVGNRQPDRLRLEVTLGPGDAPDRALLAYSRELFGSLSELVGLPEIRTGDEAFDARFMVRSRDPDLVQSLLLPRVRTALLALQEEFQGHALDLQVDDAKVRLRKRFWTVDTGGIQRVYREGRALLDSVLESLGVDETLAIGPGETIELIEDEATPALEAMCQVCGDGIQDVVHPCPACGTPHHPDCWEYMGRCSTYGCAGDKGVEVR